MLALGSIRRSGAGPSTACGREVAELFGVPMVSPHTSPHRPQTPHHTLPGSLWFCAPGTVNIHGGVEVKAEPKRPTIKVAVPVL